MGKIEGMIGTLVHLTEDKDFILDAMRFDKGNKSAGFRVRTKLQEIRVYSKVIRMEILKKKKQIGRKKRL